MYMGLKTYETQAACQRALDAACSKECVAKGYVLGGNYCVANEEGVLEACCCAGSASKCGNDACDAGETAANCPTDCGTAKKIEIYVWPDADSFDLAAKTFEGKIIINNKKIKVSATDNVKIYQQAVWDPDWKYAKHYTFAEFQSLIKNWKGPEYPFMMKGIEEHGGTIKIDEIIMKVQ